MYILIVFKTLQKNNCNNNPSTCIYDTDCLYLFCINTRTAVLCSVYAKLALDTTCAGVHNINSNK